jgi:nitrogen fixation/metabolism regulation signal transduction histidine kinase
MPIRKKILLNMILLSSILVLLTYVSLQGVYAYRDLTVDIGALSYEVQELWSLGQDVSELRSYVHSGPLNVVTDEVSAESQSLELLPMRMEGTLAWTQPAARVNFLNQLNVVEFKLKMHRKRVASHIQADPLLASSATELQLVDEMLSSLNRIQQMEYEYKGGRNAKLNKIAQQLDDVALDAHSLFQLLTDRMRKLRAEVRATYKTWSVIIISSGVALLLIMVFSYWFMRRQVVQPFKILLSGSRRIAAGDFDHRIILRSHDELAELADAQNTMTSLFVEIKNNLDEKVRERTQEVVRSEQLASVGFLAAGVAHEINNPLASIAWSAESLESRLHELLHQEDRSQEIDPDELKILSRYLKKIQEEAFRCKGITERLLDFSRLGETQRKQQVNIYDSVNDVVELVRHLGQYRSHSLRRRSGAGSLGQPNGVQAGCLELVNQLVRCLRSRSRGLFTSVLRQNSFSAYHRRPGMWHDRRGQAASVRTLFHSSSRWSWDRPGSIDYLSNRAGSQWKSGAGEPGTRARFPFYSDHAAES